ncbi:hypothetical protein [Paenibacillus phocaensis]|uniref:hypothetical protein n=1 Tax=Paenibacillus phocaensis TaxID=1776378 RepID=UPI000839CCE8|nr:hypothetical protein [Paenibacillus phocaensis]
MRVFKLFFSLSLVSILLSSSVVGVSAKGSDEFATAAEKIAHNVSNYTEYGEIELQKGDFDKIFESDGPVYLGDGLWAEELTYDEMIQKIAINRNESIENVRRNLSKNEPSLMADDHIFYVHFYEQFEVGDTEWYPQIDIYAKCQGIYRDFIGIEDLNLIRSYNYESKQFSGKLQAKVESNKRIYWVINGDFYNNGTTKTTFGGSVGIDKYATLNLSIESQDNHFGYVYKTGYIDNR